MSLSGTNFRGLNGLSLKARFTLLNESDMKFYRMDQINFEDGPRLSVRTYLEISETPKGYWVREETMFGVGERVWVSKTSKKRLCHPTLEAARQSFLARKRRQILLLSHQLENARFAKSLAENYTTSPVSNSAPLDTSASPIQQPCPTCCSGDARESERSSHMPRRPPHPRP